MTTDAIKQKLHTTIIQALKAALIGRAKYFEPTDDILTIDKLNYVHINLFRQEIRLALDFCFDDEPDFLHQVSFLELAELSIDDVTDIKDALLNDIQAYFLNNPDNLPFDYQLRLIFDCQTHYKQSDTFYTLLDTAIVNANKKLVLKQAMNARIDELIHQGVKFDDETLNGFCRYLCDLNLMDYDEADLMAIIDKIYRHYETFDDKQFKYDLINNIQYQLSKWKEGVFLPRYYQIEGGFVYGKDYSLKTDLTITDQDKKAVDLFVQHAYWQIKYFNRNAFYCVQDLKWAVRDFNNALAYQYLEYGTDQIDGDLLAVNNEHITARANDVLADISIVIKQETGESYRQALSFIVQLLKVGFPRSYKIIYQLKDKTAKGEKYFLPIKGLAKSGTHRFFAHALQYPAIYDDLAAYAKVAIHRFEWYLDVEMSEKSLMPSSYAVFGLALADKGYFGLLERYLKKVDDEHQNAHRAFVESFVERWGIDKTHLPLLDALVLSGQFDRPFKSIVQLSKNDERIKAILLDYIANQKDGYKKDALSYLWFGK